MNKMLIILGDASVQVVYSTVPMTIAIQDYDVESGSEFADADCPDRQTIMVEAIVVSEEELQRIQEADSTKPKTGDYKCKSCGYFDRLEEFELNDGSLKCPDCEHIEVPNNNE